jgi:hypothetical protein
MLEDSCTVYNEFSTGTDEALIISGATDALGDDVASTAASIIQK